MSLDIKTDLINEELNSINKTKMNEVRGKVKNILEGIINRQRIIKKAEEDILEFQKELKEMVIPDEITAEDLGI